MENYLISIIVPIYNNEEYLDSCIMSIINQSYNNLEIILIDDGSTDDSPKICDEYKTKDERIKVVHKKNEGVAIARNVGLDIATGDYISFVDSDDFIDKEFCKILLKNAVEYKTDITQCGYYRTTESKEILSEYKFEFDIIKGSYNSSYYYVKGENCTNFVCNKLFSKNIINNIRFPNTIISEDFAFNVKAYYNSDKTIIIPNILYYYIDNSNSVTNSEFNLNKLDAIKIGKKMFEFHKNRHSDLCSFFALYIVKYAMKYYEIVFRSSVNNKDLILQKLREVFIDYFKYIKGKALIYAIKKKTFILILMFLIHPKLYIYFLDFWRN